MTDFWNNVGIEVQKKTKMSSQVYSANLRTQEKTIIDFLSFNCYPDEDDNIFPQKKEILSLYIDEIATTISKIEVYDHDLAAEFVEAIFMLNQFVTSAEFADDIKKKQNYYDYALKFSFYCKHLLHIHLVELYQKRIKYYKKNLRDFNHKGVIIEGKKFDKVVKEKLKEINPRISSRKVVFKSFVTRKKRQIYLCEEPIPKNIGLEKIIKELEELIKLYESNYSQIISNGYNKKLPIRILNTLLYLLSCGFLAFSIIQCFRP